MRQFLMSTAVKPDPQSVMDRLQSLTPEELQVVERVLMQLEINRTVGELTALTDDLETRGMTGQLPGIIEAVRQSAQKQS